MPPPYKTIKDLPEPVQKVLPVHAQEIFQNAVNAAWEQFEDPKQRLDPRDSREEVASRSHGPPLNRAIWKDSGAVRWRKKT